MADRDDTDPNDRLDRIEERLVRLEGMVRDGGLQGSQAGAPDSEPSREGIGDFISHTIRLERLIGRG